MLKGGGILGGDGKAVGFGDCGDLAIALSDKWRCGGSGGVGVQQIPSRYPGVQQLSRYAWYTPALGYIVRKFVFGRAGTRLIHSKAWSES